METSAPAEQTSITDQWDSASFQTAREALANHKQRVELDPNNLTQLRILHDPNQPDQPLLKTKVITSLLEANIGLLKDPNWPTFFLFPVPRWPDSKSFDIEFAKGILGDETLGYRLGYAVQTLVLLDHYKMECPLLKDDAFIERKKEIWQCLTLFHHVLEWRNVERDDCRRPGHHLLCWEATVKWFDKQKEPGVEAFWRDMEKQGKILPDSETHDWWGRKSSTPFCKGVQQANADQFKDPGMQKWLKRFQDDHT